MTKIVGFIDIDNKATVKDVLLVKAGQPAPDGTTKTLWHRFYSPKGLTKSHACILQAKLGYPRMGYGMDDFKIDKNGSTWSCYRSCD